MNRKLILIIGAQRSGKSYYSNELIKEWTQAGNSALVYNLGKPTDFAAAKEIFPLNFNQHAAQLGKAWKKEPEFLLYEYKDKLCDFRTFSKDWAGRAAKTALMSNDIAALMFEAYFQYVSNCLLVIDDAKSIFRYGLSAEHIQIFNRMNHTGRKNPVENWRAKGSDVIIIFHSLDHVNEQLFDAATHIINFRYVFEPDFKNVANLQLRAELEKSFKALSVAPKYSYTITNLELLKTKIFIHQPKTI